MVITFRPSGFTALKTDMILFRKSVQEFRNISQNHCQHTQNCAATPQKKREKKEKSQAQAL